ncbi:HelD family protein [Clostridium hydrogenum]|uniref:HelD family protein n=1 Tax=Clostridium hydrogenum TaxID=2855764 RepID=UPI001F2297A0|nr:UvrD-helicase domain-containing protein [Clostridium hydrogenum]
MERQSGEIGKLIEDKAKEQEFSEEADKLKGVIEIINREILNYIEKRKAITKYIVDSRKKNISDFEDDEDRIIEYFDHERYVKEESYRVIDKRLKELTTLSSSPYFGRVDFNDSEYGEDSIYVGRFGVTLEGSYEPLVVDWRAPIASLFYTASLGETKYKSPDGDIDIEILKKRQYIIKKAVLKGLFDSEVDVKDDILQMVLSENSGSKLRDIVMTIQAEQDNIIRQPRNKAVIVNGTAGSGKTTIALHRVAYLLYNYRNVLQDKVLILGPNQIFIEYIREVLPTLGEEGVNQETFKDFALNMVELDTHDIMSTKNYMEHILSGDEKFIEEIKYKLSDDYINELDKLVKIENSSYENNLKPVIYYEKEVVSKKELTELFDKYYIDMPLFRRNKKIKRIIFGKIKDARDAKVRQIEKEYKEAVKNASEDELKLNGNEMAYKRKLRIREAVEMVIKAKKELTWLLPKNVLDIYKTINGEKMYTIDDLAPLIYLRIKLEGIKLNKEIKHVVIDEAQDYSKLQFIVIKELTNCLGMTIVGDSNQRLIPVAASNNIPMESLSEVLVDMDNETFKLNKSYRSTAEIMQYANKFLKNNNIVPLVRNGEKVEEIHVKCDEEFIEKADAALVEMKAKGFETVGIICRNMEETKYFGKLLKNNDYIKIVDRENIIYSGGQVVIPSYLAKGLEFDGVIMVDTDKSDNKNKVSYVMATRALHKLYDIHVDYR